MKATAPGLWFRPCNHCVALWTETEERRGGSDGVTVGSSGSAESESRRAGSTWPGYFLPPEAGNEAPAVFVTAPNVSPDHGNATPLWKLDNTRRHTRPKS
ncbi:hypothetical protein WU83_31015 [Mycobacterium nebraskense]|nr:hypothetical protein WU83_31015 [Mycobacterium nebraskense]